MRKKLVPGMSLGLIRDLRVQENSRKIKEVISNDTVNAAQDFRCFYSMQYKNRKLYSLCVIERTKKKKQFHKTKYDFLIPKKTKRIK